MYVLMFNGSQLLNLRTDKISQPSASLRSKQEGDTAMTLERSEQRPLQHPEYRETIGLMTGIVMNERHVLEKWNIKNASEHKPSGSYFTSSTSSHQISLTHNTQVSAQPRHTPLQIRPR